MSTFQTHAAPSEDVLLWRQAGAGQDDAFAALVARHQRRVWLVCRQYLPRDEAEAATQDAFLKAYTRLSTFDGRCAFSTWLTRIAINTCLDLLRRSKRRGLPVVDDGEEGEEAAARLPDDAADPERRAIERQAVRRLRQAELRLPRRQQEIFRLRFYAELELEEIAAALGVRVGTVKTQLHRVVHRLRRELGDVR